MRRLCRSRARKKSSFTIKMRGQAVPLCDLDRRDLITGLAERREQPLEMVAIARFAFDVEAEPLGRQVGEDALVRQFEDVDRFLVEDARDMEQRAGAVLQDDAQRASPRCSPIASNLPAARSGWC